MGCQKWLEVGKEAVIERFEGLGLGCLRIWGLRFGEFRTRGLGFRVHNLMCVFLGLRVAEFRI